MNWKNAKETLTPKSPATTIDLAAGRRAFMRTLGLSATGMAAVATGLLPTASANAQTSVEPAPGTDVPVLNFALNLEYLEAEFYLLAAFGRNLDEADTTGRGRRGEVRGGRQVKFETPLVKEYAEELAGDEEAHVKFLRAALGDRAVARPLIDLRNSFTAAAAAAGLIGEGETFDAFANETNFLLAAFIFEDVGVTAYKGAAALIRDKAVLEAAAGILAVEAYHAGTIRTTLLARGLVSQANAISDARDSLDGPDDLDQGIRMRGVANITPTDRWGIAFSRTTQQVLNIVYLDPTGSPGGFFPRGTNGPIR
jgi:hypothetical protein